MQACIGTLLLYLCEDVYEAFTRFYELYKSKGFTRGDCYRTSKELLVSEFRACEGMEFKRHNPEGLSTLMLEVLWGHRAYSFGVRG